MKIERLFSVRKRESKTFFDLKIGFFAGILLAPVSLCENGAPKQRRPRPFLADGIFYFCFSLLLLLLSLYSFSEKNKAQILNWQWRPLISLALATAAAAALYITVIIVIYSKVHSFRPLSQLSPAHTFGYTHSCTRCPLPLLLLLLLMTSVSGRFRTTELAHSVPFGTVLAVPVCPLFHFNSIRYFAIFKFLPPSPPFLSRWLFSNKAAAAAEGHILNK